MWDEITLTNSNGSTIEFWEWTSHMEAIAHSTVHVIICPMLELKLIHVSKKEPQESTMIGHYVQ